MVKKQAYTGSSQKGKLTGRIDSPDGKDIGCVATLRNPHQQHVEGLYKREGGRDQTNSIGLTLPLVAVVPRLFLCALFFDWKDVHLVPRLQISTLQRQYNILKKLLTFSPRGQSGHERQKVNKSQTQHILSALIYYIVMKSIVTLCMVMHNCLIPI